MSEEELKKLMIEIIENFNNILKEDGLYLKKIVSYNDYVALKTKFIAFSF
jgi:hypothetical protein